MLRDVSVRVGKLVQLAQVMQFRELPVRVLRSRRLCWRQGGLQMRRMPRSARKRASGAC